MTTDYAHISNSRDLREEILNLRIRSERQKEHIHHSVEQLKLSVQPKNLIRQVWNSLKNTGKNNQVIKTAVGLSAGMVGKNLLFARKKGFFNSLWSTGVEIFLSRLVSRSIDPRKLAESKWLNILLKPTKKKLK